MTSRRVPGAQRLRRCATIRKQLLSPIVVVWLMIFCWNILGDALNDILNPRAR